MNAYCTVADVSALTKNPYGDNSSPTEDDVERFMEQGYHRINLILKAQNIATPIDSTDQPEQYSVVSSLNALYAAMKSESKPRNRDRATEIEEMYRAELKELKEGGLFFDESDDPETEAEEQSAGRSQFLTDDGVGYGYLDDRLRDGYYGY